jgi:hypothetical protein
MLFIIFNKTNNQTYVKKVSDNGGSILILINCCWLLVENNYRT